MYKDDGMSMIFQLLFRFTVDRRPSRRFDLFWDKFAVIYVSQKEASRTLKEKCANRPRLVSAIHVPATLMHDSQGNAQRRTSF